MPPRPGIAKSGGRGPAGWIGTSARHRTSGPCWSSSSACRSIVGAWKRVASGSVTPNAFSIRENSLTASSECPPRSKKLSPTPTAPIPSTSAQIFASVVSVTVRGAIAPRSAGGAGTGSAATSTLPLGVSGKRSTGTKTAGIM